MSHRAPPSWEPVLPARRPLQSRQALGRPYVWEGRPGEPSRPASEGDNELSRPATNGRHAADRARAVIGDELRKPTVWCQLTPCIEHYTHPDALGEADIATRAIAAGWRLDAIGRLVCPRCQQRVPLWNAAPPARRTAGLLTAKRNRLATRARRVEIGCFSRLFGGREEQHLDQNGG